MTTHENGHGKLCYGHTQKLTSYDFSDLHITGEFNNRPSTGRFLRNFLLRVIHPQLLKRNVFFCIYVFGLQKWNIYVNAICTRTSSNTRRLSSVAVRLIKHRPVPGRAWYDAQMGIDRFVQRFSKVPGAFQTSYDARPVPGRSPLKPYNLNLRPKLSGFRPMYVNTVRCPADVINPHWPYKTPYGLLEFLVVPKLHQAPYDV